MKGNYSIRLLVLSTFAVALAMTANLYLSRKRVHWLDIDMLPKAINDERLVVICIYGDWSPNDFMQLHSLEEAGDLFARFNAAAFQLPLRTAPSNIHQILESRGVKFTSQIVIMRGKLLKIIDDRLLTRQELEQSLKNAGSNGIERRRTLWPRRPP